MNKRFWSNILIVTFIFWLCLPYAVTVFYDKTGNPFVSLMLNFIALFFLILGFVIYAVIEKRKNFRRNILLITTAVILIYFITYKYQMRAADYVYFKLREKIFNEFVESIKNYNKITQMTNDKEYARKLNNKLYGFTEQEVKKKGPYGFSLYSNLIDLLNIDESKHKEFFKKLDKVDCKSFEINENAIVFTTDATLGNCYGVAYSESGEKPQKVDCGKISQWREVAKDWYAWSN